MHSWASTTSAMCPLKTLHAHAVIACRRGITSCVIARGMTSIALCFRSTRIHWELAHCCRPPQGSSRSPSSWHRQARSPKRVNRRRLRMLRHKRRGSSCSLAVARLVYPRNPLRSNNYPPLASSRIESAMPACLCLCCSSAAVFTLPSSWALGARQRSGALPYVMFVMFVYASCTAFTFLPPTPLSLQFALPPVSQPVRPPTSHVM